MHFCIYKYNRYNMFKRQGYIRKERFIHFSRPIHFIINDLYERAKTAKFFILFFKHDRFGFFFLNFIITKQLVGILW